MAEDKKLVEAITSMDVDFAQWYTDVCKKAELMSYSSVKGCMIFKPAGYAIGIVENMSYFKCPDCGNIHYIYGKSNIDKVAEDMGIKNVAKMPIDPHVAEYIDAGRAEELDASALDTIFKDI